MSENGDKGMMKKQGKWRLIEKARIVIVLIRKWKARRKEKK